MAEHILAKFELNEPALRAAHEQVFGEIWRTNAWGDPETRSGPGSTTARTSAFRATLEAFLENIRPQILYDAPCGDFNWMRHVRLPRGVRYIGADIVTDMIAELQRTYASPERRFLVRDIVLDPPLDANVWLCRESLFHLPLAEIERVLIHWRASSIEYFLATTSPSIGSNQDIAMGAWRPINMEIEPFGLGLAQFYLPDAAPADPAKVVGVWRKEA